MQDPKVTLHGVTLASGTSKAHGQESSHPGWTWMAHWHLTGSLTADVWPLGHSSCWAGRLEYNQWAVAPLCHISAYLNQESEKCSLMSSWPSPALSSIHPHVYHCLPHHIVEGCNCKRPHWVGTTGVTFDLESHSIAVATKPQTARPRDRPSKRRIWDDRESHWATHAPAPEPLSASVAAS